LGRPGGTDVTALLQEALRLHRAGRLGEAETRYRRVLAQQPRQADALHYLGLIAYRARRYDMAADLIGQAVSEAPDSAPAHVNLGNALLMQRRAREAEAAFRRALALDPREADAAFNLGNLLRGERQPAAAEAAYAEALARNPHHAGALANLANLRLAQQRTAEAARAFGELGNLLQDLGRGEEAADAYRKSLALAPDPAVEAQLALLTPVIPASVEDIDRGRERLLAAMARMREAGLRLPDPLRGASSALFYTAYQGRNDRELKRAFAQFHLAATPGLAWAAPHCAGYVGPSGKLRVGFASRFLHPEHPIGKYYSALIDRFDRDRFDVVEFRIDSSGQAAASGRAQSLLPRDDLERSREIVAAARLDALFYPEVGMDPATYFLAYARLAPVQCTTLGHPVTTGIPAVDYFVSADLVEVPEAQAHYTETLIRLAAVPHYFVQRAGAGAGAPPAREELGLEPGARLYVCAQNPIKIHPELDPVLAEILRRDPAGTAVLFHGDKTERWGELLAARIRRTMPDVAARVALLPFLGHDAWLAFLRQADAVLDTPHFAGGTTSLEMFAVGVPILTWPGDYARSRQTQAYYRQMGIDGPVARSPEQYVELALRLAQDAAWRECLRAELLARAGVLYENDAAVRELESFLGAAVAAAAAGRKLWRWPS
jgi:predicted O-linked N-acetylglucosamine transferase (SPINDLY family)